MVFLDKAILNDTCPPSTRSMLGILAEQLTKFSCSIGPNDSTTALKTWTLIFLVYGEKCVLFKPTNECNLMRLEIGLTGELVGAQLFDDV